MALAQVVLEKPKMSNHARGLWGYSGLTSDGRGLTVQSTGMGGPSAALVLRDLAALGVRRAVRIGTCTALTAGSGSGRASGEGPTHSAGDQNRHAPEPTPGDLITVREARAWAAGERGAGSPALPAEALAGRLRAELGEEARQGTVASLDVLHPTPGGPAPEGDVADMQTAALLAAGRELGVELAAVLIVTEAGGAEPLADDALANRAAVVAKAAIRALFA